MNLITFSTLACPNWPVAMVISKAREFGYDGIEWRGGPQGHIQPSTLGEKKIALRQMSSDSGLVALAVTAYTSFVSSSADERQSNVDELKRYSDLAAELGAQYIRTFLGKLPPNEKLNASLYSKMADCLSIAAEHALSVGVKIAIEPHDDFVRSSSVIPILKRVQHPALRVIWDIGNTFAAGEDPADGIELLKERLAYVQVKDGKGHGDDWQLCSLGQGEVPLAQAFELLLAKGYDGAFSVEWEYAWHPELDPPEVALPAALRKVQGLLAATQPESA